MDYTKAKKGKWPSIPLEFYVCNREVSLDKPSVEPSFNSGDANLHITLFFLKPTSILLVQMEEWT